MKHYIRSYWTKYKQLYKKGLKGLAAFLAIGAIVFFVLATIASRLEWALSLMRLWLAGL